MSDHPSGKHTHGQHGWGRPNRRRLGGAFVIILLLTFLEAIGGSMAGSLALLADAGHMAANAVALGGMSWAARRLGKRQADAARTYGFQRFEVLAAYGNGCILFFVAVWIVFQAIRRFATPVPVLGGTMLIIAIAGLLANAVALYLVHGDNRNHLNVRSAWMHVLGDLVGIIVTIVAAGVILWTGWSSIDPIFSLLIALLILKSAVGIVKELAHILLKGTADLNLKALRADLTNMVPGAVEGHVNASPLRSQRAMITLNVRCGGDVEPISVIRAIIHSLYLRFFDVVR